MAKYREVRALSPVDAAYIAGLVDGEGTISLARKHAGDNRQLIISISNTEARILDFVLATIGAGKITRKRTTAAHHTPSLTYAIWNRQALVVLGQIGQYLRSYKQLRAELILSQYVRLTPRNGRYSSQLAHERNQFEQAVLSIRPTSSGLGRWREPLTKPDGEVRELSSIDFAFASPFSALPKDLKIKLLHAKGANARQIGK